MPVSDVLKNFRQGDYGGKPDKSEESGSSRVISLTEEEAKALSGYGSPGEEITCTVSGKLEGDHFHVMKVESPGPEREVNADAQEVMAKMRGPMTPMQVQPSPS